MESLIIPYFGKITIDKSIVEQNFEKYIRINNSLVEFNLIFETVNITISDLVLIKKFLNDFERYFENARIAILKNYHENGQSKDFIQTHLDAMTSSGKEILKETFLENSDLDEYFLNELELNFVYIFPDDSEEFIKFNYQVSEEFTDEFLFVRFGKDFSIKEISTEY